jgi:hypothetical protein
MQDVQDDALLMSQAIADIRYLVEGFSHSKKVTPAFREVERWLRVFSQWFHNPCPQTVSRLNHGQAKRGGNCPKQYFRRYGRGGDDSSPNGQ